MILAIITIVCTAIGGIWALWRWHKNRHFTETETAHVILTEIATVIDPLPASVDLQKLDQSYRRLRQEQKSAPEELQSQLDAVLGQLGRFLVVGNSPDAPGAAADLLNAVDKAKRAIRRYRGR
ncbi:hypothetical protein [Kitasatospora kifunensis]|uniref:Multidrug resistance efflux pump n=1 Tax=Kitasatospora kifunensis TaxID=58351 RepID=A0A7W7R1G5_KITKI|nr:hypothetical protein [Kitasatospora kifunensis]MBB4923453.1 multidrug resistance efflux pump [Kitasatospora kifunensis]